MVSNSLYHTVNKMMCELGAKGEITTRSELVSDVMDALHSMDGGVYQQHSVLIPEELLDDCQRKLEIYHEYSDGCFHGGVEHSALMRRIAKAKEG